MGYHQVYDTSSFHPHPHCSKYVMQSSLPTAGNEKRSQRLDLVICQYYWDISWKTHLGDCECVSGYYIMRLVLKKSTLIKGS
jgi:hypothetical protein